MNLSLQQLASGDMKALSSNKSFNLNAFSGNLAATNSVFGSEVKPTDTTTEKKSAEKTSEKKATSSDTKAPESSNSKDGVREVIVPSLSDGQKKATDKIVDSALKNTLDVPDAKTTDHVIYKDEKGNKMQEVVTRIGSNGDKVITTIDYDAQGRPANIKVEKEKYNDKLKAYTITFSERTALKYTPDGHIIETEDSGPGRDATYMVERLPIVLDQNGNQVDPTSQEYIDITGNTFARWMKVFQQQ